MLVLTSCSTSPPIVQLHKHRLSSSLSTSSTSSFILLRRRFSNINSLFYGNGNNYFCAMECKCCCTPNLNFMSDSLSSSTSIKFSADEETQTHLLSPSSLLRVRSGEELLSKIRRESDYGRLPENVASALEELYFNYCNAVISSGASHADKIAVSNMNTLLDLVLSDVKEPYIFPPHHRAVRERMDYYAFGQNYIRPLVDFGSSYVGNITLFHEIEEKLQQGHNVVLMSNHQTEADPAIIALLLEKTNSHIAENMIYIAGDRVVTDPVCKPFSIGRNLLCVYSKKHMHDDPDLIDMKKRANTRSLKEMALLLRGGSQIIWIAPSGGRDRPDPATNRWYPAPFDLSSVDNMRRLVEHAGVPGHIYPLALICYDIMPPPPQVEKEIGEKRFMSFHGAGLSVMPEIKYCDVAVPGKNEEEVKSAYGQSLYNSVKEQYKVLEAAIHGKQGLRASTPTVSLSQPWIPC